MLKALKKQLKTGVKQGLKPPPAKQQDYKMDVQVMPYESVIAVKPDWPPAELKVFFQKLSQVIGEFQGAVHHIDSWGVRRLANRNKKKCRQGLYFHFSFNGRAGVVPELSRRIRMNDHIIYHHFEKLSQKKSLAEHLKSFRDMVAEAIAMEKERLARLQKRKQFTSARRDPGPPPPPPGLKSS